jgi:hypothetical protein
MARKLNERDIKNILYGATFLGSGGGGTLKDGLRLLSDVASKKTIELELINTSEIGSNEYAVMVAGIGAPKAMEESNFGPEAGYAFEAMQKIAFFSGKELKYLMAGELGGFNTMVPMYLSILKDIPFVDGDGNGRAVPELSTGLYPIYDIPPTPLTLAGGNGDTVIAFLKDPKDHKAAENIARHISMAYGMSAAFCTWVVDKHDIVDKLAPESITRSQRIGEAISSASKGNKDALLQKLNKEVECKEICIGKIREIEIRTEEGFDFGTTIISGAGKHEGTEFYIDFKNENMLVRDDRGNTLVTVPDLICMLDLKTMEPLTNASTEKGMEIGLYGVPAPENWWKDEGGFNCWKHILEKIGYTAGPVRV